MKKVLISALAAFGLALSAVAAGELVASGADVRTWRLGEVGGGALTNCSVGLNRTVCPWKLYVTNAVKRAQSTAEVFTPTSYVVTASVTVTNDVPTWADFTNSVTNVIFITDAATTNALKYATVTNVQAVAGMRLAVTNRITTATTTNWVTSIAGLSAPWAVLSTNGVSSVVTNYTETAAGGTVKLENSFGDTWTLSLSGGAATSTDLDIDKLVFAGDLRLTASDAERLEFRMVFLTFQR